jgi:hypothetical protein
MKKRKGRSKSPAPTQNARVATIEAANKREGGHTPNRLTVYQWRVPIAVVVFTAGVAFAYFGEEMYARIRALPSMCFGLLSNPTMNIAAPILFSRVAIPASAEEVGSATLFYSLALAMGAVYVVQCAAMAGRPAINGSSHNVFFLLYGIQSMTYLIPWCIIPTMKLLFQFLQNNKTKATAVSTSTATTVVAAALLACSHYYAKNITGANEVDAVAGVLGGLLGYGLFLSDQLQKPTVSKRHCKQALSWESPLPVSTPVLASTMGLLLGLAFGGRLLNHLLPIQVEVEYSECCLVWQY